MRLFHAVLSLSHFKGYNTENVPKKLFDSHSSNVALSLWFQVRERERGENLDYKISTHNLAARVSFMHSEFKEKKITKSSNSIIVTL